LSRTLSTDEDAKIAETKIVITSNAIAKYFIKNALNF
jgi:hypothetical protein